MRPTFTKNIVAALGAAAILSGVTSVGAFAAQTTDATSPAPAPAAADTRDVTYSGRLLIRIRTGAGGFTADQRASAVYSRLIPILSLPNLRPDDVTVSQSRPYQDAAIYVRGVLFITVDQPLAQANGNNDPGDLARVWADRLQRILPDVSVKPDPYIEQRNTAMLSHLNNGISHAASADLP